MTRIFLARHGETDWNLRGKLQGHTDIPLNESGRAQAAALATRLATERVASVTTSNLSRAGETGAIVARALLLDAPHVNLELRERCFGVFEGLTREECAAQHPEAWNAWIAQTSPPEGAEAVELAVARVSRALARVADRSASAPALVVSHGGVMRLWLQSVLRVTIPLIANGTVYVVEREGAEFSAARWER